MGKSGTKPEPQRSASPPPSWLEPAWSSLARRLAVAAGSAAVVIALLAQVPLQTAVGRGALAWISVLALLRVGGRLAGSRVLEGPPDATEASGSAPDPVTAPTSAPATRANRA